MIFPGMPEMPKLPGVKVPNINAPTRTLTMDLSSDKKVNAKSKAECAIPEGLKLGPKVNLTIDLPEPVKEPEGTPTKEDEKPGETPKFVMKTYWGCAETVPDGQPKVIETDKMMTGMSAKDMDKFRKMMEATAKRVEAEADNSHAYWPGRDNRQIDKEAATPGAYALTTNYCGETSFALAKEQDFLAPIELVGMEKNTDLAKTIKVEWKSVPNAEGYLLSAFAGTDMQMVIWTSSSDPEMRSDLLNRAISRKDLDKLLDNGVLLPPTKTSCRIPAGIFKDMGNPMLMVTAFGTDKIQTKDGIETHVVVRSNAMASIGVGGMDGSDDGPAVPAMEEAPADNADGTSAAPAGDANSSTDQNTAKPTDQNSGKSLKDKLRKKLGGFKL
jgi:hypothetical protein